LKTCLYKHRDKEVEIMTITVSGRKMPITDALRQYAEEKIGNAIKAVDADTVSTEIVLYTEKNPANPLPAICEVTVRVKGHIVRVEECEEDMYAAIDVAAAKVARQLRKYKTRVVDKRVRATERIVDFAQNAAASEGELDLDKLMDELAGDEIVRTKEIEFTPMTEEAALVQIDLLGHDFFAYTDRDTNQVHILYRRDGGGYGLLKQKEN
jgi:putative sigma-54 modulation protein